MKCYTCKSKMKCIDDVNTNQVRIDWYECDKCKSTATIVYGDNGKYIKDVEWKR